MITSQKDLFAYPWDTNFQFSPFVSELGSCDQQENTVEFEYTCQPGVYHKPIHDNSKNKGGLLQNSLLE